MADEAEWIQFFKTQKEKAKSILSDIVRIEKEIDQVVYELFELIKEEIKIVESS